MRHTSMMNIVRFDINVFLVFLKHCRIQKA